MPFKRINPLSIKPLSESPSLAQRQQQLVERILFAGETDSELNGNLKGGLAIYRNNLKYTASRALLITYPVLTQLVGERVIQQLASQLLKLDPPTSGDWGDWGEPISQLIATSSLGDTHPFLTDIARFEWARHQVARSKVTPTDPQALSAIQVDALLQTNIELAPSVQLLKSDHPIEAIWLAHQHSHETNTLDENLFAEAIGQHNDQCQLLIYQYQSRVQMDRLSTLEFQWFSALKEPQTLSKLLDDYPEFNFISWLSQAIARHWIRIPETNAGNY